MKPLVYVETSVISYLAARPSRRPAVMAAQQFTREWWAKRDRFELVISQIVSSEVRSGDSGAAERRLSFCAGIRRLPVEDAAATLARGIMRRTGLAKSAEPDALHIAIAAMGRADYLLTWNMRHIAAAANRPGIESACADAGTPAPLICTPTELMEP